MRIGIVGCNAAGLNAALAARKTNREAYIFIVDSEGVPAYSRCGLPYVISEEIRDLENLVIFPKSYYRMMRLDLKLRTTAKRINEKEKTLSVEHEEEEDLLNYDRLILATGSRVFFPPVKGLNQERVYPVRRIADGERIIEAARSSLSAVVIGGGLIGLEMAVALRQRGLKVTVVEMLPEIAPNTLDPDMAQILRERLEKASIEIVTGTVVDEIEGTGRDGSVRLSTGRVKTDLVIVATGVRPNTELAKDTGIRMGETGGVWVNQRLQTSVKDIFAAGECAESINFVTGRPTLTQFGTSAVKSGRVAGINASGGYATFPAVLNSSVSKLFKTEVGSTGLTEKMAELHGFEIVSGKVTGKTRAQYYPGAGDIVAKLIFNKANLRLIGAQLIGEEEITHRINTLSMAIKGGMTIWDLESAESCYTPPLAETWEPALHEASEVALLRMKSRRSK